MSTEITVVVGADSLLKRDKSTRNARRRDRLDSEALRSQVKDKAEEEDKSKGFNNKQNEYDPSRDPAAHARKKKDASVGGFTTCNISQIYNLETSTGANDFGGGGFWSGGKFMDIKVKAIKEDGTFGNEVEFTFNRNRLNPIFYVSQSDLGVNVSDLELFFIQTLYDKPPNRTEYEDIYYTISYQRPYDDLRFGPTQSTVTPTPGTYLRLDDGYYQSIHSDPSLGLIPNSEFPGSPAEFEHYISFGERFDFNETNFDRYSNDNRYLSLGSPADIQGTMNRPGYLDPAYQTYMLPLNSNHAYLVFLYADVVFTFRAFAKYHGTLSREINVEGPPPQYDNKENYYVGLGGTAKCKQPEYFYPSGLEITDGQVRLSDKALNKIQEVKIVELKDGVATIISDEKIPQLLRQRIISMMPVSDEIKLSLDTESYFFGSGRKQVMFWDYQNNSTGPCDTTVYATDDNVVYKEEKLPWFDLNSLKPYKQDGYTLRPAYTYNKARERSLAKGYGFGYLQTNNHFDSVYVDSLGYPFSPDSSYMANDTVFSPAIYSFLSQVATPSTSYAVTYDGILGHLGLIGAPEASPKRFISIDHATKEVSSIKLPSSLGDVSIFEPVDSKLASASEKIPIFQRATHYAWNWDNPEFCWQQLINMGFTAAMIGPKPENPTDE